MLLLRLRIFGSSVYLSNWFLVYFQVQDFSRKQHTTSFSFESLRVDLGIPCTVHRLRDFIFVAAKSGTRLAWRVADRSLLDLLGCPSLVLAISLKSVSDKLFLFTDFRWYPFGKSTWVDCYQEACSCSWAGQGKWMMRLLRWRFWIGQSGVL